MRINPKFDLRQVGDEYIIVANGVENVDFTRIVTLNDSAARLWEAVYDKEFTTDHLTELLMEWYETDEETARKDSERLVNGWLDAGMVE